MSYAAIIGAAIAAVGAGVSADAQQKQRKLSKRGSRKQELSMLKQAETEKKKLSEAEGEIGRKKALRQGGGRSMLMSSAPKGASTIGGQ